MNAAIFLLSSAWMVGQTPEVIIPVQHQASGGASAASCCDSGPRLVDRIRGLFQRDCCNNACAQPRCHSFQWPQLNLGHRCPSSCDRCGHRAHHASCDSCGHGDLLERIRSVFQRDCGCNAGCRTRCCTSGAAPAAEALKDQPKKLPSKSKEPKKGEEARVITSPARAPLPAIQNAPALAPAPAIAPRIIENDTRNPF